MATQINQDRIHAADRGDLSNPQQSAGFVVDPVLSPVVTNIHPISPDPSPSSDPAMFDQSTRHPNTHYHPEKKLKKKKKIKKFGGVSTTGPTPANYFAGAESFTKHETEAEQKQKSREEILAHKQRQGISEQHEAEESGSEYEDEEDEAHPHAEEEIQSKQQNHSERISGLENTQGKGTGHMESGATTSTPNVSTTNKQDNDDNTKRKSSTESGNTPSLLTRASETASGLASRVMNTSVVSSAAGMVTSVLNKVGLKKSEGESTHDNEHEKDKESQDSTMNKEGGNKQTNTQQTSNGQEQTVAAK